MPRPSSTSASRWRGASRVAMAFGLAFATVALLSLLAMQARPWLDRWETGRWVQQEWRKKMDKFAARRGAVPSLVVVGDSTASMGISPSEIARNGFNFARAGLQGNELPVWTAKMEGLGIVTPRFILMASVQEQFKQRESDRAFLDQPQGQVGKVLQHYYSDQNLSQNQFLPGTRVLRFLLDSAFSHLEKDDKAYHIEPDGLFAWNSFNPPSFLEMPNYTNDPPGFMEPALLRPLQDFHDHWTAKGVALVFVILPKHPVFLAFYRKRFRKDDAIFRQEVLRIFHGRVIDLEDSLPATAMSDSIHLNREGARTLSRLLAQRLGLEPCKELLQP